MEVYGYTKNGESEEASKMSEVAFLCSIEEIEILIDFLKHVKAEHGSMENIPGIYHTHFKDWKKEKGKTDLVIVTQI